METRASSRPYLPTSLHLLLLGTPLGTGGHKTPLKPWNLPSEHRFPPRA